MPVQPTENKIQKASNISTESWRRNLYTIAVIEFLVLMSYSFTGPFMPMFIQSMGKFTDREAAFWSGLTGTISGIAMFLTAPLWGIVADRWGRKPMVLRAMFGITVLMAATALAPNVFWVIMARGGQGFFAGSMSAASALVASTTPRDRVPQAMGTLMVASFGGNAFGPLIGGVLADATSYTTVFYIVAGTYLLGGLAVLFLVKERFSPLPRGQTATVGRLWNLARSREILPLLIVLCVLSIGPSMLSPVIPLFIGQLKAQDAATASGFAFSLMGVVASLSSLVAGRLAGRISMKRMMVFGCIATGATFLPPVFATTVTVFIVLMSLRGVFNGGIMVPSNSLIALSVSETQQGMAYGLQQSANSLGGGIGPLIGGALAGLWGLKIVFPVAAGLFMVAGVIVMKLLPEVTVNRNAS